MDMLTYSKEREPERVDADLNETVDDVIQLMQGRADEMNVQLGHSLQDDMPHASFDPDAIHRAVLNLITNAIDAVSAAAKECQSDDPDDEQTDETDSGFSPRVFVQTRYQDATGWLIDVVDNGLGITQHERNSVFTLLESSKGMRGTGLGLPVSDKIVREHGGRIELHDPEIGRGICFRIVLPTPAEDDSVKGMTQTI